MNHTLLRAVVHNVYKSTYVLTKLMEYPWNSAIKLSNESQNLLIYSPLRSYAQLSSSTCLALVPGLGNQTCTAALSIRQQLARNAKMLGQYVNLHSKHTTLTSRTPRCSGFCIRRSLHVTSPPSV